ncbi:MAG: winged helix-turn-helix transcriptional regulator [Ramlibacter sp.]|nr:winged helix-turn-helix transcriptional regulator [Ramlibacter sp.]
MAVRRPPALRALLGYHINSTSEMLRRGTTLRLRRDHDFSLMEWRTLVLIEYMQPVRLRDLVAFFGADKAQISRIVTALSSRGLVARRAREDDARSAPLELTLTGRAKAGAAMRSAQEQDEAISACLVPAEREQLIDLLTRIRSRAVELLDEEARLQPGQR